MGSMREAGRGVVFCAFVATVVLASSALAAGEAPAHVTLSLDGVGADDSHHGTFTASAPLCPGGTWGGDGNGVQTGTRTFTCADGSGSFRAEFDQVTTEHTGGTAPWQVTGGTGRYAALRGLGTGTAVITVAGDQPTFTETWQGTMGFDTTAPSVTRLVAVATRTNASHALLRLTLGLQDDVAGNAVAYHVSIAAGNASVGPERVGTTTGSVRLTYRLAVPARFHRLLVLIAAEDPVGNSKAVRRVVLLGASARHRVSASGAASAGEPKNEPPFTRSLV